MDNLTHSLFGATLGRTPLRRVGRGATLALVLASNAPDIDVVTLARGSSTYMTWHRGPTHGPLGVLGLGLAVAALVSAGLRALDARKGAAASPEPVASFPMLVALSVLGVLCHVLMDLPTSYGTRLLSPFDWHWYAFDWMPIVDVYLLGTLAAGMLFVPARSRRAATAAALALSVMAADYGLRATTHRQALLTARQTFASVLPQPCGGAVTALGWLDRWPRDPFVLPEPGAPQCLVEVAATPTFFSPFKWRVITRISNAYAVNELDLLDGRTRDAPGDRLARVTLRYPDQWRRQTLAAAASPEARVFLGFSRFPVTRTYVDGDGRAVIRWTDARFTGGLFSPGDQRRPDMFSLAVTVAPDGSVSAGAPSR